LITLKSSNQGTVLLVEPELSLERQQQAKEYAYTSRYLMFIELVLTGSLLLILIFGGLSARLTEFLSLPVVPAAVIYFLILIAAYGVILSPLIYYRGFVLPRRYRLSHQSLVGWLSDLLKAGILALALGAAVVAAGYWFITILPQLWWLLAWGFAMLVSLVLSILAPVVVVPFFYNMKPLADSELKERLEHLARRAGIKVGGIYNIEFSSKSTMANAAMMGVGRTRRIVLSDTLISQYSVPEIEVIMAHEMGHNRHRDVLRLFVFQSAILLVTFYASGMIFRAVIEPLGFSALSDVSALPLLILIFGLVSLPFSIITTGYGRRVEAEADSYALELTDDPNSFISAIAKVTDQNLAEAEPNRWVELLLYDHPSYRSRLEHAKKYFARRR
jgi:STE24 endopeptidase